MSAVPRLLLLLCLTLLLPLPAWAEKAQTQLSVHGTAQLEFPADQARLNMAVVTTAPSAAAALEANSSRFAAVEKALTKAGLEAGEYRTGQFEIRPQWSPRPRNAGPDWQPTITGYTVSNSLQLATGKLDLVGTLIEAGIRAGANRVDGLSYGLADTKPGRARAIALAVANARSEAQAAAAAAGVKLGKILSMQLEPPAAVAPVRMIRLAAESAAPPLTPGEITVGAGVSITFAIAPR